MKKILISLMLILPAWLLPISAARAAVPTIDATVLVEAIMLEISELLILSEEVTTVATQYQELAQEYTDFQQMITEFQHYINQMETVDFNVDDWGKDLFDNVLKSYGSGDPLDPGFALTVLADHLPADFRTILEEHGLGVETAVEMTTSFLNSGFSGDMVKIVGEAMKQANIEYDKYSGQIFRAKINKEELVKLEERKDRGEMKVSGLGDEDHVKALKVIAGQQLLAQENMQLLSTIANQQLLAYEPPSIARARAIDNYHNGILAYKERVEDMLLNF